MNEGFVSDDEGTEGGIQKAAYGLYLGNRRVFKWLCGAISALVSYLSTGTTLQTGIIPMTGTPGDLMDISVSQIGTLKNRVNFV
ncbi:Pc12g10690 [Penicillium rubens Wisconsin 54-1255]|uniref:Pc12g10690 protein n=1 Tax=Penicillium rubens (strain ATCC 28089 / DSM 1075 / NRRL 1951 / Wisconsin 54-1255) TaxID=500485 RepID=B6H0Z2_PENRW|nr:Pc12g10690 [Penicillium rubens Wisconsin 54-1255]